MDVAAGASSAAPLYFDPLVYINGLGEEEMLVDGAIIANNPSLYAYIIAGEKNRGAKIRVVSLGAGMS